MDEQKSVKQRKWIVLIAALVALLGVIVATVWFALKPRSAAEEQEKSYNEAKRMISIGQYEKAYFLLQDCITGPYDNNYIYYKDTKALLSDFLIIQKITKFNENGEMTYRKEAIAQEELGKITYITDLCDGSAPTSYSEEYKDGKLVREVEYDADGNEIKYFTYEYDQRGNQVAYYKNDKLMERREYAYDQAGRMISETVQNGSTSGVSCYIYEYDRDGKCIRYTSDASQGNFILEYQYDEKGNRIGAVFYDINGNKGTSREMRYDRNGNCVSITKRNAAGDIHEMIQYKYDNDGNCIRTIIHGENNKVTNWADMTYDEKGNRISRTSYDANSNVTGCYKATYDANGKRLWEASYDAEGKVVSERRWSDYTIVYLPAFGK